MCFHEFCLQWANLIHYLTFKLSIRRICKSCQHRLPTFAQRDACHSSYPATFVIQQCHRIIPDETSSPAADYTSSELIGCPKLNHSVRCRYTQMSSNHLSCYLPMCLHTEHYWLRAAGMSPSWLRKKGNFVAHQPGKSALFTSSHTHRFVFKHMHTASVLQLIYLLRTTAAVSCSSAVTMGLTELWWQ